MELVDLVNSVISNNFTQIVNFPAGIPDCDCHSPALLNLFISSDASIFSTMAFPSLGNSDHVVVSVSIDFPLNSHRDTPFHRIAYYYSHANWDGLRDHLRDVPWQDIFKLSASAASQFCEWVQVGINVYIHHRKYQLKPHSSSWFSAASTAVIVHGNNFFVCINRINLLNLEESLDSLQIVGKGFLKLPNWHMLIKQNGLSLLRNMAIKILAKFLIVFSTKVNLLYLLYSTVPEDLSLHLIKQNCLLKTFLRTLILMTQVSLYLFAFLKLI